MSNLFQLAVLQIQYYWNSSVPYLLPQDLAKLQGIQANVNHKGFKPHSAQISTIQAIMFFFDGPQK